MAKHSITAIWRICAVGAASLLVLLPLPSQAVTQDNFLARNTADLVALCTAEGSGEMQIAAVHFCEGYFVGTDQYYLAERAGPDAPHLFCMPDPPPTRTQAISMFVDWARSHPQYMSERPVDTIMRFTAATWPCRQ